MPPVSNFSPGMSYNYKGLDIRAETILVPNWRAKLHTHTHLVVARSHIYNLELPHRDVLSML